MKKILPWLCFLSLITISCTTNDLKIVELRCENDENPIAIQTDSPKFGWQIHSEKRSVKQAFYRIRVAESSDRLATHNDLIWDSGQVESDQSLYVPYDGIQLQKGKVYYWNVEVWDNAGRKSNKSNTALFRITEQTPEATRKWIAWAPEDNTSQRNASVWYRKEFELNDVNKETAFAEISTPGYYELYVNGIKVGEDVISPATSRKEDRIFAVTYDIAPLLKKGSNVIGIWAGRGWNGPGEIPVWFYCKVGDTEIETDKTWKAAKSPYTTIGPWAWGHFGGESYDAGLENKIWSESSYDAGNWSLVHEVVSPSPRVEAQQAPLNRLTNVGKPKSVKKLNEKQTEIDFGRNMTGSISLKISGLSHGDKVNISYADRKWQGSQGEQTPAGWIPSAGMDLRLVEGNDTVRYTTYGQYDEFISAGEDEELFLSKFNFHGFRYVIVEGCDISENDTEAFFLESDLKNTGEFVCSVPLINDIHELNHWTMRCLNQGGIYVDCQTRERLGYGDGQVATDGGNINFDMHNFYIKWLNDWQRTQNPATGEMPSNTAPIFAGGGGGPAWKGPLMVIPWKLYAYYNDTVTLRKSYGYISKYLDNLYIHSEDGLLKDNNDFWQFIGDWLAPGRGMDQNANPESPMKELFNNCYVVWMWDKTRQMAQILGMDSEVARCEARLKELRHKIHETYYNHELNQYVIAEQSYYVLPLISKVVPPELEERVFGALEANILRRKSPETGMLGTFLMIEYLTECDRADLLYTMFVNTRYPGWGYMLDQGATTIWEQWNGYWSQIHSCFNSADTWIYKSAAGIIAGVEVGSKEAFVFRPSPVGDLNSARATYMSIYGKAEIDWQVEDGVLKTNIVVPANSTAEVWLPSCDKSKVTESGISAESSKGVIFLSENSKRVIYKVGSGSYEFISPLSHVKND